MQPGATHDFLRGRSLGHAGSRGGRQLPFTDFVIDQMLQMHILCALNQGMDNLDTALLRLGRLRCYRHIGLLSQDEARKLATHHDLPLTLADAPRQYSLADIFHAPVYKNGHSKKAGFQIARK